MIAIAFALAGALPILVPADAPPSVGLAARAPASTNS